MNRRSMLAFAALALTGVVFAAEPAEAKEKETNDA